MVSGWNAFSKCSMTSCCCGCPVSPSPAEQFFKRHLSYKLSLRVNTSTVPREIGGLISLLLKWNKHKVSSNCPVPPPPCNIHPANCPEEMNERFPEWKIPDTGLVCSWLLWPSADCPHWQLSLYVFLTPHVRKDGRDRTFWNWRSPHFESRIERPLIVPL